MAGHILYRTMSVITEGRVSSHILSFAGADYLYTGSVCTSWRRHAPTKTTSVLVALTSVSRIRVALSANIDTIELLDVAIVFGASMSVLRAIAKEHINNTCMTLNYAAFTGNMDIILFLDKPFDARTLFEAVRGGQLRVVRHIIGTACQVGTIVKWPSDKGEFVQRCLRMAESAGRQDVARSLTTYVTCDYYRSDMGCVELSIRTNRLDVLRTLHEAGAIIPAHAFAVAVESANLDILRYIESVKLSPGDGFIADYIGCEEFDITTLELVLELGVIKLYARDLQQAIHARMDHVTDLMLQYGCAVHDETIDHAVAAWDFTLAERLMSSHTCRPTRNAYEWLFTGGVCECCATGFYPTTTDDFYLSKLEWIYSSTGRHVGFKTMADMENNPSWSILFKRVSPKIKAWFAKHVHY